LKPPPSLLLLPAEEEEEEEEEEGIRGFGIMEGPKQYLLSNQV